MTREAKSSTVVASMKATLLDAASMKATYLDAALTEIESLMKADAM